MEPVVLTLLVLVLLVVLALALRVYRSAGVALSCQEPLTGNIATANQDNDSSPSYQSITRVGRSRNYHAILALWQSIIFLWFLWVQYNQYSLVNSIPHLLSFYTVWNFHLQIVYFGVAAAASWCEAGGRPIRPVQLLAAVLFEVVLPSSMLVMVVFWAVLAPPDVDWIGYNQHLCNTGFLVVEWLANRLVLHWSHLILVLLWSFIYIGFSWIRYIFTGSWCYFFLKLSWGALAWYPALLVLNALAFLGVAKLTNCKKRVAGIQLTELDAEVLQLEDAASVRQKDEETELNVIVQKDEETELDVIVQQQSTRRQN